MSLPGQPLLQQFHHLPLLEQAARSAIGCWFNIEQALCSAVQNATAPGQIFPSGWFGYWGVGRNYRKHGDRPGICQLLYNARPPLLAAPPNAQGWQLVEKLSLKIQPMNCGVRPTSLVSKFAFSCSPTTFVPFDNIVRGELGTPEHNYLAYRDAFNQRQANIKQQLGAFIRPCGQVGLAARNLPLNGDVMNQQLFVARTTDWYLLLRGGFDPIKAGNPVHDGPMI